MSLSTRPLIAHGKQLLIKAALKLAVHSRSIRALGVREVGREAGLNPNTFYRHFSDMDDLGLAILESVVSELRPKLRELRREAVTRALRASLGAASPLDAVEMRAEKIKLVHKETARLFFDFVLAHPEAFIIGVSELHGASPKLRLALRDVLNGFAADMSEDNRLLGLFPMLDAAVIDDLSSLIVKHMFFLSAEFMEYPERREAIRAEALRYMLYVAAGAVALKAPLSEETVRLMAMLRSDPAEAR